MKKTMCLTFAVLALAAGNVMACPIGPTACDAPDPNPADALKVTTEAPATAVATNIILQQLLAEVKALRNEMRIELITSNVTLQRVLQEQMLAKEGKSARAD